MIETILKVPGQLTAERVIRFGREIEEIPPADRYVFDLGAVRHVEPFGMLMAAALLRQFVRARRGEQGTTEFKATDYKGNSYASFMGFYRSFGLKYGNEPGAAAGNQRYIPLTKLHVRDLQAAARRELVPVGEAVEAESQRVARVLIQQQHGDLVDTLTYSLREIFRNVVEHSQAPSIWYAAQYWPTRRRVEIGILDEGIGIREALSRNPKLTVTDDLNALHLALQPGISGVRIGRQAEHYDVWANSGYGLYMTSALCQRGGDFLICSGGQALIMSQGDVRIIDAAYQGTAIRLVLDTSSIDALAKSLDQIRKTGEKLARESLLPGNLSASMISRMLSRDRD